MDQNATALERAFQLAKSGHFATIDAIKRQLRAEGYVVATVTGTTLSKQLRALIQASQAASSATKQGAPYGGRAQEQSTTTFFIEPTQYGWSVRAGTEQLGLFVTQRQALIDVKRRHAEMQANGQHSMIVTRGQESKHLADGRLPRHHWTRSR